MRRTLAGDEFSTQLRDFKRTALRCEMQPWYWVASERDAYSNFLAGSPVEPINVEGSARWLAQVANQRAEGRRMERVRIHRDPPTDYQRWIRWTGQWNIRAGERIDYLTEGQATVAGLLAGVAQRDWWLFDDKRLMVLTHNEEGRRIHTELITDEAELDRARAWWDLAVHTTRGENI
ncbi:DUF6879 family protein [Actinoplanes sp. NPDC051513]|uniref:DUF6879 family protein n=1 Tax=Actinoplanes sp. NPDC051513 TaxID=3363908 RepID=UPI00379A99B3